MRLTTNFALPVKQYTPAQSTQTSPAVHFGKRPNTAQLTSNTKAVILVALGALFGNLAAPWVSLPSRFIEPTNFQTLPSGRDKSQRVQNLKTGEVLKDNVPDWSGTINNYQVVLNKIQLGKVKEVHYVNVSKEHQAANPVDVNGFTVTLTNGAKLFLPPNQSEPAADQAFINQLAALKDQGYEFAHTGLLTHP